MTTIDSLVAAFGHADPTYLYLTLFFFAFLENLFPPTPSDLVIAFGGSLVGIGKIGIVGALVSSTIGSTLGFAVMYYVGFFLGKKLVDAGRPRFLPFERIRRAEKWFARYGYGIIIANRFLSGTRAVISFFAGLTELPISITLPLCAVSALLWNSVLGYGGSVLGHNWKRLGHFLDIYGFIVLAVILVIAFIVVARQISGRRRA